MMHDEKKLVSRRHVLQAIVASGLLVLMGGSSCSFSSSHHDDDDFDDDDFHGGVNPLTNDDGLKLEVYVLDTAADGARTFSDIDGISVAADVEPGDAIDGPRLADFTTRLIEENEDLLGSVDAVVFDAADFRTDSILVTWRAADEREPSLQAVAAPALEFVFDLAGTLTAIHAAPPSER